MVVNLTDKDILQQLFTEKERFIQSQAELLRAKDETIKMQVITINILQAELNKLKVS